MGFLGFPCRDRKFIIFENTQKQVLPDLTWSWCRKETPSS